MKRQLHVLWLVVACCNMSLAQSGLECKDKEYAYFEKDASGRLVQKCSSSTQPNVARVKQQMPLYMCVDDAYINPLSSSIHRNICDITNFASNFIDALEAAMAQWNAICPGGEVDFQYS